MDSLPYSVIYEELPEKSLLSFSGQLIINYIENISDIVTSKVNASKDLEITIDQPDTIDVTFVQLVVALTKTVEKNGKKVTVKPKVKEEIKTLIGNSGFGSVLNLSK